MKRSWRAFAGVVLALIVSPLSGGAASPPKAELWDHWTAHAPDSETVIDHSWWTGFLGTYIESGDDGINRVAYGRVGQADKDALKRYVAGLAGLPIERYNRDEQFAYWINLYNALSVDVILDHYPVKSVLKISISPGWFSIGPWGKKLVTIGGVDVSLDDIEHRILRPIWKDPRTHYALNCTAFSCPNLLTEAFTGANAGGMLDVAAWDYINRDGTITTEDDGLVVSSIFEWYKADFGGNDASLISHLMLYADGELAAKLEGVTEISDHRYNWVLNDAKGGQ
jgi:hypothetical protein